MSATIDTVPDSERSGSRANAGSCEGQYRLFDGVRRYDLTLAQESVGAQRVEEEVVGGEDGPEVQTLPSVPPVFEPLTELVAAGVGGKINHSACKWCYPKISLEDFCVAGKGMGLTSIDLVGVNDLATVKKHGLVCAMARSRGVASRHR